jgi:hypothetical protein
MKLSSEDIEKICDTVVSYATGYESVIREFEIEPEELEELLLDNDIEKCEGCDWFFHSYDLVDDDGELVGCRDCRPTEEDE